MQLTATNVEINSMNKPKLIYIAGPTASGKTALAITLANHFKTEILSCDSRQFYKEMSIGTAVPSEKELSEAPHHFIQYLSITDNYSVGDYRTAALKLLKKLFKKHDTVIMVGGSGLYADAVIQGLDEFPEVDPAIRRQLMAIFQQEGIEILQDLLRQHDIKHYQIVDRNNPHRLIRALEISLSSGKPYSSYLGKRVAPDFFETQTIVIDWEREKLYERINTRVDHMIKANLINEAQALHPQKNLNALQTVGYRELFAYFDGEIDKEFAQEEIKKNTRRYAKRQVTWFRKYDGVIRFEGGSSVAELIKQL